MLESQGIEVYVTSKDRGSVTGTLSAPLSGNAIYVNSKNAQLAKKLLKVSSENHDNENRSKKSIKDARNLFTAEYSLSCFQHLFSY